MSYHIDLPYDPIWKALDWAKKYCKSYITNIMVRPASDFHPKIAGYKIRYYFGQEKDAVYFALMWL